MVGIGPGTASRAKVYSGADGMVLADFSPFGSGMTAGVKVALAYIDGDATADVVVGTGPGGTGTIRAFAGASGTLISGAAGEFQPFGAGSAGVNIVAGNDPWPAWVDPGPPLPVVSIRGCDPIASALWGSTAAFQIDRTGPTDDPLTVYYTTRQQPGDATPGTDYQVLSGQVVIPAGEDHAAVIVRPIVDGIPDGQEWVGLSLAGGTGYATDPGASEAEILITIDVTTDWGPGGNGPQPVRIDASDPVASEVGPSTGSIRVTRIPSATTLGQPLTVYYTVTGSTATSGVDYAPLSGSVTIPAGSLSAAFEITPIDDRSDEGAEDVVVTLQDGAGYVIESTFAAATVSIVDDDKAVFDLDVNANGSLKDKVDLAVNYMPGYEGTVAKVSSGTTLNSQKYTGQKMKLVLDGRGLNDPNLVLVKFVITGTTSHPGYCSNGKAAEVTGKGKERDYSFSKTIDSYDAESKEDAFPVLRVSSPESDFGGKMEADKTWVYFWAKDYGGAAKVEARTYVNNGAGGSKLDKTYQLVVPKDQDEDGLADQWEVDVLKRWKDQYAQDKLDPMDIAQIRPQDDGELHDPDGRADNPRQEPQKERGDSHTMLEEYRGYILDGGGLDGGGKNGHTGGHLRLNPARKEILVEVDKARNVANEDVPPSTLAGAMNLASGVFSNTAVDGAGRERGAGIYMYWVADETDLEYNAFTFGQPGVIDTKAADTRDTPESRAAMVKNLSTDFVHFLFIGPIAAANVPPASTNPSSPDLAQRGSYLSVPAIKAMYNTGTMGGDLNANKYDDFFAIVIAHEITHLLGAKAGTPGFNDGGHTTDPNENNVVNVDNTTDRDLEDRYCLMYKLSRKENRELATVRFFNLVKKQLRVATNDGIDP